MRPRHRSLPPVGGTAVWPLLRMEYRRLRPAQAAEASQHLKALGSKRGQAQAGGLLFPSTPTLRLRSNSEAVHVDG